MDVKWFLEPVERDAVLLEAYLRHLANGTVRYSVCVCVCVCVYIHIKLYNYSHPMDSTLNAPPPPPPSRWQWSPLFYVTAVHHVHSFVFLAAATAAEEGPLQRRLLEGVLALGNAVGTFE